MQEYVAIRELKTQTTVLVSWTYSKHFQTLQMKLHAESVCLEIVKRGVLWINFCAATMFIKG